MRYENSKIYEKYEKVLLMESTKGNRRKCQVLEDKIDDFMDQIEKEIDKIEDNPTFQRAMYQLMANTSKEMQEFVAILKQMCQVLDSGAKVIPAELPAVGEKMEAANNVTDEKPPVDNQEEVEQEEEPATEDQEDEFELKVAKKGKKKKEKK